MMSVYFVVMRVTKWKKSKQFQLNRQILLAIRELAHNMLYNVYYKSHYDLIYSNLSPSLALLRVKTSFGGHADEGRRVSRGHLSLRLSGGIILGDGGAPPFHQGIASGDANRDPYFLPIYFESF